MKILQTGAMASSLDIKAEGLWDQMQSDAAAELDAKALEDFIAQ